jgi:hypothetical protein
VRLGVLSPSRLVVAWVRPLESGSSPLEMVWGRPLESGSSPKTYTPKKYLCGHLRGKFRYLILEIFELHTQKCPINCHSNDKTCGDQHITKPHVIEKMFCLYTHFHDIRTTGNVTFFWYTKKIHEKWK